MKQPKARWSLLRAGIKLVRPIRAWSVMRLCGHREDHVRISSRQALELARTMCNGLRRTGATRRRMSRRDPNLVSTLPDPPSLDRSDPAVMRRAAGVAKRRNTLERRKLPLLADLLPVVTAEQVMDQREQARKHWDEIWPEIQAKWALQLQGYKDEVRAQVSAEEYERIAGNEDNYFGPPDAYWYSMRFKVKKRQEPITDEADLVLAWLQAWEGPAPTPYEIHQRCGDGLTLEQIRAALEWLLQRDYAKVCVGRPCTVSSVPFCCTYAAVTTTTNGANNVAIDV